MDKYIFFLFFYQDELFKSLDLFNTSLVKSMEMQTDTVVKSLGTIVSDRLGAMHSNLSAPRKDAALACNCSCPEPNFTCKFDTSMCPAKTKLLSSVCVPVQPSLPDEFCEIQLDKIVDNVTSELINKEKSFFSTIQQAKDELSLSVQLAVEKQKVEMMSSLNFSLTNILNELQPVETQSVSDTVSSVQKLGEKIDEFAQRLDTAGFTLDLKPSSLENRTRTHCENEDRTLMKILYNLDMVINTTGRVYEKLLGFDFSREICTVPDDWIPPNFFIKNPLAFFLYGSFLVNALLVWILFMSCYLLNPRKKKSSRKENSLLANRASVSSSGKRKKKTCCGCCRSVKRKVYFFKKKFSKKAKKTEEVWEENEMEMKGIEKIPSETKTDFGKHHHYTVGQKKDDQQEGGKKNSGARLTGARWRKGDGKVRRIGGNKCRAGIPLEPDVVVLNKPDPVQAEEPEEQVMQEKNGGGSSSIMSES